MALLGKKRTISPTLSTTTVEISIIFTDLTVNLAKVPILLLFLHLPSQATFWLMEGLLDSYV
jgi:hypothetical protein